MAIFKGIGKVHVHVFPLMMKIFFSFDVRVIAGLLVLLMALGLNYLEMMH